MSIIDKASVIKQFARKENDTGSPEVQVAILTKRLERLTSHMKKHPKDFHSQRGLLKIVSKRKRLLKYLMQNDFARYQNTISTLNLRK